MPRIAGSYRKNGNGSGDLLIPVLSTRSVTSTPKRPGNILGGVTGLTPGQITRDGVLITGLFLTDGLAE